MEIAECILLVPQLFLHVLFTYTNLLHIFLLKPILLLFPSTCSFHFIRSQPCLHFPSTSCTIFFIKTSFSGHLKTWPYHLTPFTLAILSATFFNPNMSISSTVLFSCRATLHCTVPSS